jgi:hypothetical protein
MSVTIVTFRIFAVPILDCRLVGDGWWTYLSSGHTVGQLDPVIERKRHTVSCLEPSGYTVKVESVLMVSLHGCNTWVSLHCTFPMLPYILSVSIYPWSHHLGRTFTLCSLICLTFDTYSSASASRSIRPTYKDP